MTPAEKAKELVDKFRPFAYDQDQSEYDQCHSDEVELHSAKQCALIAVQIYIDDIAGYEESCNRIADVYNGPESRFWNEVKQEIEKMKL